jgi:hypothetical protein
MKNMSSKDLPIFSQKTSTYHVIYCGVKSRTENFESVKVVDKTCLFEIR